MHEDSNLLKAIYKEIDRLEQVITKINDENPVLAEDRRISLAHDYIIMARNQARMHGDSDQFIYTFSRIVSNVNVAIALFKEKENVQKPGG